MLKTRPSARFVSAAAGIAVAVVAALLSAYVERATSADRPNSWSSGGRGEQANFDYYALVLSWSPTHCASSDGDRDELQCNRRDGKRYNFILHGLWPQYSRGYPQDCSTRGQRVPQPVIDRMIDIMPSAGLIIHEYRKHGSCSGLDPSRYFDLARGLFTSVRIPDRYRNPNQDQFVSPRELEDDFLKVNPDLKPDMMVVSCGGGGNRLREIRICMSKQGRPQSCGSNEDQRRLCSATRMFVPPVRSRG